MTDHRRGSGPGSRRPFVWAFSALSIAAVLEVAAAGCGGSHGAAPSPAAATSSAVALSSAEPTSMTPGTAASPSTSAVGSASAAAGSAPATAPGAAGGASSAAGSNAGGGAGGAGAASTIIRTCKQQSVTRPADFILACGDGTTSLGELHWSNWGAATASATGVYETVVCSPSCAAGAERSYPATVSLTGLTDGVYTQMSISAPKSETPRVSYTLGSAGPRVNQN